MTFKQENSNILYYIRLIKENMQDCDQQRENGALVTNGEVYVDNTFIETVPRHSSGLILF